MALQRDRPGERIELPQRRQTKVPKLPRG
jgi:hypothetical protein